MLLGPRRAIKSMRVLICGGRHFSDAALLTRTLDNLWPKPTVIIHGGCTGADLLAAHWSRKNGIPCAAYPADWKIGKSAGPKRNAMMLKEGKPELVIAMPGGKGTANLVLQAEHMGIKVRKIEP